MATKVNKSGAQFTPNLTNMLKADIDPNLLMYISHDKSHKPKIRNVQLNIISNKGSRYNYNDNHTLYQKNGKRSVPNIIAIEKSSERMKSKISS